MSKKDVTFTLSLKDVELLEQLLSCRGKDEVSCVDVDWRERLDAMIARLEEELERS